MPHIIQMDPDTGLAHRFEAGSLIQTAFYELQLPHTTIPFNSEDLFSQLRREIDEAAGGGESS